ncbi:hypothetical protein V8C40DRAFT_282940 [Trichoderma camerunense]
MDDNSRKRPLSGQWLIETVERVGQGDFNVRGNVNITPNNTVAEDCLRSLFITDPSEDRTALKRKKGNRAAGTCEWILETDELNAWLGQEKTSNVLWLYGNPGIGKSTMAIFLTEKLSTVFSATEKKTLAFFFCDSSFDKRKTATSVIRGLLSQLVQQHRQLLDYILPKYKERGADLFKSFDALWTIFMAAAADEKTGQKYCIIDALDECDRESQKILLQQFQETFLDQDAWSKIRFLVTSRPYSEIDEYLNEFANKDLASFAQAEKDIDRCINERVAELAKRKRYTNKVKQQVSNILRDKAEGTFLWVGLACEELREIPSKDAVRVLQNMPKGLHSLYTTLLDTAQEDSGVDTIRRILSLIAVCVRPLSVLELSEACQLYEEEVDIETRGQFTRDQIASCRLMIIVQDEKVLLLHQSVKDYLVGANSNYFINELEAHANFVHRCVNLLMERYHGREQSNTHFFNYAIERWPDHARMAKSRFEVRDSEAEFFQVNSQSREHWLEALFDHWDRNEFYNIPRHMSILHIAGRWGIASLVDYTANQFCQESNTRKLISSLDLDCVDSDNATPIELAIKWGSVSVISKLLSLGAEVNERSVTAAAKNWKDGKEIITLLFDRYGDQILITESIIKAAAGNYRKNGVMALLLDRYGDQIVITEDIVKAAASNYDDEEAMALLLDQYGDQIIITEDVLKSAARSVIEMMTLLFDRRGDEIVITEDIIKAAAGNYDNKVIALLLNRQGDQMTITEDILKAAADSYASKGVMELLLDRYGDKIAITEDIIKTAAANLNMGKEIITILLDRCGDRITITEDVVKTAARRGQVEILNILSKQNINMSNWEKWYGIAKFKQAAGKGDVQTIEQLLDQGVNPDIKDVWGHSPLFTATAYGHEAVVKILAQRADVNINSTTIYGKSSLMLASGEGFEGVVTILMEAGADPRIVDEHGDTAVIIARRKGFDRIAMILERVG